MSTAVPTVAVGAVVLAGAPAAPAVLLIQRGRPPGVGLWTLPGGKVALGEPLAAAVEREVREETGLTVVCGPLVEVVERVIPAEPPGTGVYHYVILDYLATCAVDAPAPRAGDDAQAAAWVRWDDLATWPLTDGLRPVLERARRLAEAG